MQDPESADVWLQLAGILSGLHKSLIVGLGWRIYTAGSRGTRQTSGEYRRIVSVAWLSHQVALGK